MISFNGDHMAAYMPSLTVDQNALKTKDIEQWCSNLNLHVQMKVIEILTSGWGNGPVMCLNT